METERLVRHEPACGDIARERVLERPPVRSRLVPGEKRESFDLDGDRIVSRVGEYAAPAEVVVDDEVDSLDGAAV